MAQVENAVTRNIAQRAMDYLAGTAGGKKALDARMLAAQKVGSLDDAATAALRQQVLDNPLKTKLPIAEGVDGTVNPLATGGSMIWNNIKNHPWQTAGTAVNAAGNLAGLFDNDQFLGQALATVGGGLVGNSLGLGPLGIANSAMIGGNLGMLFDKLQAKKKEQEQYR